MIFDKIKRYSQVSKKLGSIIGRTFGNFALGINSNHAKTANEIVNALGELKGPLVKIAQIFSTIPNNFPFEYQKELTKLQQNAPYMEWPFVQKRMENELGKNWINNFKYFHRQASAAASFGQVHKAYDINHQVIACKLQYPNMETKLEADLNQFLVFMEIYYRYDKTINPREIYSELKRTFKRRN